MKKTIVGLSLLLLLTAGGAFAGTVTRDMQVTATVVADCVIDTVGTMNFGNALGVPFTVGGTDATASANVQYTCTNSGVAPHIRFGQGLNPAAGSTDAAPLRRMRMGATANYISYALYSDGTHSTPWTNATPGVAGTADGTQQTVTVYGVATAANVPAGAYNDTVTVSVDF